jgi:hypothetical protein
MLKSQNQVLFCIVPINKKPLVKKAATIGLLIQADLAQQQGSLAKKKRI